MKVCKFCGKPLSDSQWKNFNGQRYKSCPNCSDKNGEYHVFHLYPDDFGTTLKRSTATHPEGPQSYCEGCRGKNPPTTGILCKDLI